MLFYVSICLVTMKILFVQGGDIDCTTLESFNSLSQRTEAFTMSLKEKSYSCDCRGTNCEQIICSVIERPDMISGTGSTREVCRDRITGRHYAKGAKFLRPTSAGINLACKCPEHGSLVIKCKKPQCVIPPPIRSSAIPPRINGSCYDRYSNSWHAYGIPYTRRVVMSYSPDILGFYTCTCTAFNTKCTAKDIPCCDSKTGKFVAKNHRFSAAIGSSNNMDCMCIGGRGKIGDCKEPRIETPEITPNRRRQCYDRITRKVYNENERFIKYLLDGERSCICRKRRNKMQIRCSRRT